MAKSKNLKDQIILLRNDGYKLTEISIKLNCSLATVKYHCSRNGLSNQLKISKENFEIMKKMISDGIILRDISKKLNISVSTIKRYKSKTYEELNTGRKYMSTFMKDRRKNLKIKAVEYMGGGCKLCDYKKCFSALSFHHLDAEKKDFQISGTDRNWEKIKIELDKCVMLCNNCHSEVHDGVSKII